jgi:methylenetetrahydrofolate reductase (NADPH)
VRRLARLARGTPQGTPRVRPVCAGVRRGVCRNPGSVIPVPSQRRLSSLRATRRQLLRQFRFSSVSAVCAALARAAALASIHQLVERVEDDNGPAVVTRALHRSPRPSGRSSRFHGSARIEKARSACLPSFLRPRRVSGASGCDDSPVSVTALTSAEISLPAEADGQRVSDRIAVLADTVDVVGLTDNHAGQPRMSPLAAVALAREQGVGTIVHVSCRDRNRLALQSQVVGAAALGAEGVLCMQGDPVAGVDHVADMTATELIARAPGWSVPHSLAVGAVVNPFAEDLDRELRLLQRKVAAGATFVQSQMVFDLPRLEAFLARGEDMLAGVRVYASVALLRSERMAERACALPGVTIPEPACAQIRRGGGIELARELAAGLARVSRVDALHVFPLGAEAATREVAAEFRVTRGINSRRR